MTENKKITIVTPYSLRNRGDELVLRGTISLMRKILGNEIEIALFSAHPDEIESYFSDEDLERIEVFSHPLESENKTRTSAKLFALLRFTKLLIWSVIYKSVKSERILQLLSKEDRRRVRALLESDYIVARSVDMLTDSFGMIAFLRWFMQILFYHNLAPDKLVLHAQTIYFKKKINNKVGRFLIGRIANKTRISVRDEESLRWLNENRISHYGIIPPPSIMVRMDVHTERSEGPPQLRMLIIPRATLPGQQDTSEKYAELIGQMITKHEDISISLMGQSQVGEFKDDDYQMIESIVSRLDNNAKRHIEIIDIRDKPISEFLGILQSSSFIIAERGIAVVAGLALGVPTIAIDPYGGKNIGFAKLFDFDRFALSSANLDAGKLMTSLEDIITNYDSIVTSLNCKVQELFTQLEKGTARQLIGLKDFHPQVITTENKIAPREASGLAKVSIIMVNYNGATFLHKELTEAVHSFLKTDYRQFEFIFVDNGSTDNSIEQVAEVFSQYPNVPYLILRNNDNLGFAGGCEEGLKAATGEYACLVNNDDKAIDTDWLKQLISVIQSDEKIGVAFCKKMKWDSPLEIDARGLTMNPAGLMQNTKLDDKLSDCLVWQTPVLIRRKIIDEIGGLFDEDYVVLNDDTDSSLRIWLAGYRIVYVPSAVVLHKRSATMKMLPVEFITFHGRKNTIQTVIKNYGLKNLIRWLPVTAGIYLTLYFYYLKIGRKDHARGTLRALSWNVRNFGRLMKKRRSIQRNVRKIDDSYVFSMMNRFNMIEVMKGDKVWPK